MKPKVKPKESVEVSQDDITRMVDELVKGKRYTSLATKFYEINRKKLVSIIQHTKTTVFFGTKKKLVFTKEPRRILDQKKLEAHFGGVIPSKFYTTTDSWNCAIQDND